MKYVGKSKITFLDLKYVPLIHQSNLEQSTTPKTNILNSLPFFLQKIYKILS